MEYLDLNKHSVEEIEGKFIIFNDIKYEIQTMMDEGGEAFVFPLLNIESGLVRFVGKLYKCKPESPEYISIKSRSYHIGFHVKIENENIIGKDLMAIHSELYETGGGLFRFEPHFGIPNYKQDRYQEIQNLLSGENYYDAQSYIDELLSKNPNHTDALYWLSFIKFRSGEIFHAIDIISKTISIEKNSLEYWHLLSDIYVQINKPLWAVIPLLKTLKRWKWDGRSYARLLAISLEFDLVDICRDSFNDYLEHFKKYPLAFSETANWIVSKYNESIERKKMYDSLLAEAAEFQLKNDFQKAVGILERCKTVSKNNFLAIYNLSFCHFFLKNYIKTIELLSIEISIPNSPNSNEDHLILILALSYFELGDKTKSILYFSNIPIYDSIWDIPLIPIFDINYNEKRTQITLKSCKSIIDCLSELNNYSQELSLNEHLQNLLNKYISLEENLRKPNK